MTHDATSLRPADDPAASGGAGSLLRAAVASLAAAAGDLGRRAAHRAPGVWSDATGATPWGRHRERGLPPTRQFGWMHGITGLLAIAAAATAFVVILTSSLAPAATRYAGIVHWELAEPSAAPAFDRLGERSVIYAADGTQLAVLHDEIDRRVVALSAVPPHVSQAVITAEDREFFLHEGYNLEAIARAGYANLRARAVEQGGSTITQQLAKMNFVGDEQSIARKAEEVSYAVALEEHFTKAELLERYLNEVYFGGGAYGIHAAAEQFFRTTPEELTVAQAALLAAVIRAPGALDPRRNAEGALVRRDAVIQGMYDEGYIDEEIRDVALDTPIEVEPRLERETRSPYVVEAVKREFFNNPAFGETRQERIDLLFSGGLRIHTTVEPDLQQAAADVIAQQFGSASPTAAIAAVDPRDGRVLAVNSGASFEEEQFDLATQGRRQPGSSMKTIALAAALEDGVPIDAVVDGSSPISIDFSDTEDPWEPANYGGASYGPMDLRQAHMRSVNTAFAQLVVALGTDKVERMAAALGIDVPAAMGPESSRGPAALSLGGLANGVTPLEMASAFGTFANAGERVTPYLVERVEDTQGNEVFVHERSAEQIVSPQTAATLIDVMTATVNDGTGTGARLSGWQAAGKTGTTQSSADGWFVGTVPVLATAVWVGHPESRRPINGLTGGSIPATIWQRFMTRALADQQPVGYDLPAPSSGEGTVQVPDVVGLPLEDALAQLLRAKLVADIGDIEEATGRQVTGQSPSSGGSVNAGTRVQLQTSGGGNPEAEVEIISG